MDRRQFNSIPMSLVVASNLLVPQRALAAVDLVGKKDGFLGQGGRIDELVTGMNRAAQAALH